LVTAVSSQFDRTDVGLGGRFSWHPVGSVGVEAEISAYPRSFQAPRPFSAGYREGLFGVTIGPRFSRVRPFAKARYGFLSLRRAPEPYPCILIFPPPLSCVLASGRTLSAFDLGGGVEVSVTRSTFLRVDAGDRSLKYPGPVLDNNHAAREDGLVGHDFRLAAGGGLRF
jgi:hypothetical protein